MFVVSAFVYNLDMYMINQIIHHRLIIDRLHNYDEIVGSSNKLDTHRQTAKTSIIIPEHITKTDEAIKFAEISRALF